MSNYNVTSNDNNPTSQSCISSTIDRMIESTTGTSSTSADFLPSLTWKGPREGYYFGTSRNGTGYYPDKNVNDNTDISTSNGLKGAISNRKRSRSDSLGSNEESSSRNAKSVRFGENSIQTIPPRAQLLQQQSQASSQSHTDNHANSDTVKKTAEQLLQEAEESLASQPYSRKTLNFGTTTSTSSLSNHQQQQQLKSHVLALEKSITKNQLQRAQFANSPEKFMESELSLHEDISSFQDLAASIRHYEEFVSLGAVDSLVGLLSHENVDVSLAVLSVFVELLDPALIGSGDGDDEDEKEGGGKLDMKRDGILLGKIAVAFLGNESQTNTKTDRNDGSGGGGLETCVANLQRFNESEEEELKGVDDILTLVENFLDLDRMGVFKLIDDKHNSANEDASYLSIPSIIMTRTKLTSYLLMKLGQKKLEEWDTTLRLHASEVLSSLLQHEDSHIHLSNLSALSPYTSIFADDDQETKSNNDKNSSKKKNNLTFDGMEALLQSIAPFRKKDPTTEEECEYLENMFSALAASLLGNNNTNLDAFLERQGVELMLRCMREKVHSGCGSMKVLFFAMSSSSSSSLSSSKRASETFVEAGGLKLIFPIFMGRKSAIPKPAKCSDAGNITLLKKYGKDQKTRGENKKKPSKRTKRVLSANKEWVRNVESYSIQIVYGLSRYLDDSSSHDAKARLFAKFVEFDCEKCDRLVELCLKYDAKARNAEYQYYKSDEAEEAEEVGINIDLVGLNAKLKGGGDLFHRVGALTACAATGSKRCHEYILEQLRTQNSGIGVVKAAIEEFISILDGESDQRNQLETYLDAI